MTPRDFTARVTVGTCIVTAALGFLAAWLGGMPAGVGVLAGGVLALVDFRWLTAQATATSPVGPPRVAWILGAGARFAILLTSCAGLLITAAVHPVALVLGFSVLPFQVIAHGLRAARRGA